MEQMKEKFRIDLSKTTARSANRNEMNPTDFNRIDVSRTDTNPKPENMDYEIMMKMAKEKSLQDNVTPFLPQCFSTLKYHKTLLKIWGIHQFD